MTAERSAFALWGEEASTALPRRRRSTCLAYVRHWGTPNVLLTTAAGYCLRVRPGELDAERFASLVADGHLALAAGRAEQAASAAREALALWRGAPLAELASLPFAPTETARLEEQQLAALELRVEADLAAGRCAELVAELQGLVAAHPWRERLHAQLMLALYRRCRQAEALEVYRHAREVLGEELGIEPSTALHALHQAMLTHDPAVEGPEDTEGPSADGRENWDHIERDGATLSVPEAIDLALARGRFAPAPATPESSLS